MKKIYSAILIVLVLAFFGLGFQFIADLNSEMQKIYFYGLIACFVFVLVIGFLWSNVTSHDLKMNLESREKELRDLQKEQDALKLRNQELAESTKKALQLSEYTKIIQTTKSYHDLAQMTVDKLSNDMGLVQAAFYEAIVENEINKLKYQAGYAFHKPEGQSLVFDFGDGLCGQVAVDKNIIVLKDIPDGYVEVISGLGQASPKSLVLIPVLHEGRTIGVIELASFTNFSDGDVSFFESLTELLAPAFYSLRG